VTIGLWWTYFDHVAADAEEHLRNNEEPVLAAADAYSYLHLLMVSGIIIFAVGAESAIAHPEDPLSDATRLALTGGVALYLAGHAAFGLRISGELSREKLAAAVGCLIVFAVTGGVAAWATAGILAAVLAVLVTRESVTLRSRAA
jgi:low temperature requirement protein LtrA